MLKNSFMRVLVTSILLSLFIRVGAQINDTTARPKPSRYPLWAVIIPGGTHFHDGRIVDGLLFSSATLGGLSIGVLNDAKMKENSNSPYYNYPLLIAQQSYLIDKVDLFRNQLEFFKYRHPNFQFDPLTTRELLAAPFKPKNVFTPITAGFVATALVLLYFEHSGAEYSFQNVDQMYFINRYIDRDPATVAFGGMSLAASLGAGTSEEYLFRNYILSMLDFRYGQRKGLCYSSIAFGILHLPNYLLIDKPDYKAAITQTVLATIGGFFLGRDVQKRGYNIGPAVAAHTWYNFTLMLGSFLVNPKDNVFGVNVKFTIP
jgi:membrane protease YdiL (CAAX protease family)